MKKTAIIIMILTVASKIIGFGREITLSYIYGASSVADAYLISISVPGLLFGFVSAGVAAAYIPMYSKISEDKSELEANKFTSNLINVMLIISTVVLLIGFLFSESIIRILASGFDEKTLALSIKLTRISLFSIYFTGILSIFTGYLQIKGNYIIPTLIGVPFNFFIILSIILSHQKSVLLLAIGYVIAVGSKFFFMLPYMKKSKYRYKILLDFKDRNIIKMLYIALPIALSVSLNQLNVLVDRTIASRLANGGISSLNFASRLNGFIQSVFVLSIGVVLYPTLSKMVAKKNMSGFKKALSKAITGVNLFVIPTTVGSMVFSVPIISMLFERGAFDSKAVSMTSAALFFYSIGMIGFGLRDILSRVFFAMQDTKTPMINGAIGIIINIILNIILSRYFGIGGLALATSISAIFTTVLLFISLRNKIGSFGMKNSLISSLKILSASLSMGLFSKFSFEYIRTFLSQDISLVIAICIGVVFYFTIIYFLKIDEIESIFFEISKKLRKKFD